MKTEQLVAVITALIATLGGIAGAWFVFRGKRLEVAAADRKETATIYGEVGKQQIISDSEVRNRLWDRIAMLEQRLDNLNAAWQTKLDDQEKEWQTKHEQQSELIARQAGELSSFAVRYEWQVSALTRLEQSNKEQATVIASLTATNSDLMQTNTDQNSRLNRYAARIAELEAKEQAREEQEQK